MKFLNAKSPDSPIYPLFMIFAHKKMAEMFHGLKDIFNEFRMIAPKNKDDSPKRKGSDRIPISEINNGSFPPPSFERTQRLIGLIAGLTGWPYDQEKWCLTGFQKTVLMKHSDKKNDPTLTLARYTDIVSKRPFSLVIRAAKKIEYALDENNVFGGSL